MIFSRKQLGIAAALTVFFVIAGGVAVALWPKPAPQPSESAEPPAPVEATTPTLVELSSVKIAAAKLRVAPVARQRLQPVRHLPGRIQYDQSNHIAVRTPAEGVLTEVLVKPGDFVTEGQTLARLSSREIGEARADVLRRQDELKIAESVRQRTDEIFTNVQTLVPLLESRTKLDAIEKQIEGKALGGYRETLMSAYSQFLLAEELYQHGQSVAGGALAGIVQSERRGKWEVAQAGFKSALETARFNSRKERDEALLQTSDARRRLEVAQQRLRILSGGELRFNEDERDLSMLEIVSPVHGAVEQRLFTRSERVEPSETLFIVADPKSLWVAAAVREKEWQALELEPGAELIVEPAGVPDRQYVARLVYTGREVSAESHSVPVVGALDNADGILRPGMYATVSVPFGPVLEALAVPPSAIMQHEAEKFVFVAEGPQSFRRVTVETGLETEDWVEIRHGLTAGASVVEQGAFVLKSELLLEREAE